MMKVPAETSSPRLGLGDEPSPRRQRDGRHSATGGHRGGYHRSFALQIPSVRSRDRPRCVRRPTTKRDD